MPEKKSEQQPSKEESMQVYNDYMQEHATQKCAIATAAYGTVFALELDVLRSWRDSIEESKLGRALTNLYYKVSSPIAELVEESDITKAAIRTALSPLVKILREKRNLNYF